MLNLTLVQKHFSAFRNVHHKGFKIFSYNLVKVHQKKNQIQQKSHSNSQLSSHLPVDHVDSSEISPTQFYIWQKTGYGIRYFFSFETEN